MSNVYSLSPNETKLAVEVALKANTPVLLLGSGGIGKSSVVKAIAEENNLEFIDIRLSQVSKLDIGGYPKDVNGKMEYLPLSMFPLETDPLPQGKDGWIIMLDELLQADKYTQGAAFKLVLDRQIGKYKLHPNVRIVAAANGTLNSGADNKMIAPLKSRFTHINMVADLNEFKEYVEEQVMQGNWNSLLLGFISFKPEHINNFDVNTINDVQTYSCPRTLEYLSNQINAGLLNLPQQLYENVIVGIIGESAGNDFNAYVGIYKQLPTIQEILADPINCPMPESVGAQWALSTLLLNGITPNTTNQFAQYIERVTNDDIKVVIYRTLLRKCPQIAKEPLVQKSMGLLKMKLKQIQTTP